MKKTFFSLSWELICGLAVLLVVTQSFADEFNGPFPSWLNVKTNFGAVGDGIADDTAAFQNGLNTLGTNSTSSAAVLYIPSGTYRITQTLTMTNRQYIGLIGQDPVTTTLLWGGTSGGILLNLNGVENSRFDRLTFDGNQGQALVAVNQAWTQQTEHFDTANEYIDDIFLNVGFGIRLGYPFAAGVNGASETTILRCRFLTNFVAGVFTGNFNALDTYIWNCRFESCKTGVGNASGDVGGAGNFYVQESTFLNSTNDDVEIANSSYFSVRNCISIGSKRFFNAQKSWNNSGPVTLQNNQIAQTLDSAAVQMGDIGLLLMVDNSIDSGASAAPAVTGQTYLASDTFSIGNRFTVPTNYSFAPPDITNPPPRFYSQDDVTVPSGSFTVQAPAWPGAAPVTQRPTIEVPANANDVQIQQAIQQAAQLCGQKPIVHLPAGYYKITNSLDVPASCDLQLVGDGLWTQLTWNGGEGEPVIRLRGPTLATLRDFMIVGWPVEGLPIPDGIVVENADQGQARVFMRQVHVLHSTECGLLVDQLDKTQVDLRDFLHDEHASAGIEVIGGPSAINGQSLGGRVDLFSGGAANNHLSYDVTDGGQLLAQDAWYEANSTDNQPGFVHLSGKSLFSIGSFMAATFTPASGPYTATAGIVLDNFTGTASFLNFQMAKDPGQGASDTIQVTGTATGGSALFLGALGMQTPGFYTNTSTGTFSSFMMNRYYDPVNGSSAVPDQNPSADTNFFRQVFALSRSKVPPATLDPVPAGATDLQAYKIFIQRTRNAIHLERSAQISSVTVPGGLSVTVVFDKAMQTAELATTSHYSLSGSGKGILGVHPDSVSIVDAYTVQLNWSSGEMFIGGDIIVAVSGVFDFQGNPVNSTGQALGAGIGIPPVTAITSPISGTTVNPNQTLQISATASDSSGISKVEFLVNGNLIGPMTLSGSSYTNSWRVPVAPHTTYILNSRATDNANNRSVSSNISIQTH